jgi:hypothetical protein
VQPGGIEEVGGAVDDVSCRGRRARLVAVAVVFGLLLLGTIAGDDEHFPFGPFRMYASTESPDGTTAWYVLIGTTADGARAEVSFEEVGLRRAELEGRIDEFVHDPALLADVAATYTGRRPELAGLEVVRRTQPMRGGAPEGSPVDEVVVSWSTG